MRINFFPLAYDAVPFPLLQILTSLLEGKEGTNYEKALFVVAFVKDAGFCRLVPAISKFRQSGGHLKMIVGVDVQGTTVEGLQRVLGTVDEAFIFNNRSPGHTFHPKIYVFEKRTPPDEMATVVLGSSNLTLGGVHNNYEANVRFDFSFTNKEDSDSFESAKKMWAPFENAPPILLNPLTPKLINVLEARGVILPEGIQKRIITPRISKRGKGGVEPSVSLPDIPFGAISLSAPPPIPENIFNESLERIKRAKKIRIKKRRLIREKLAISEVSEPKLPEVQSFVMTINPIDRPNIPGEVRLPHTALTLAPNFWGYPLQYKKLKGRKGERDYYEWYPKWRIINIASGKGIELPVRMYLYPDKGEFRFFAKDLRRMGGKGGDIIVLTRAEEGDNVDYICEFIQQIPETKSIYEGYNGACKNHMPNSPRKWGYV